MMLNKTDILIVGGGIFGVWSALFFSKKGYQVTLFEKEEELLSKATSNNQLRIHNGYHYPRSLYTSINSNKYFEQFYQEFQNCVNDEFESIYCIANKFSLTDSEQFKRFCENSNIYYERSIYNFINYEEVDNSYRTKEYVYDPVLLKDELLNRLEHSAVNVIKKNTIESFKKVGNEYHIFSQKGNFTTKTIINATYSSINSLNKQFGFEPFKLKYELCEIVICELDERFRNKSITVMDGPFFSIMPYGKTKYHTLSSVRFTPLRVEIGEKHNFDSELEELEGCSINKNKKPIDSNFEFMAREVNKYLNDVQIKYIESNYSIKPILLESEVSDSRPTLIHKHQSNPNFYSVLSGKVNTIFDMEFLDLNL